MREASPNAGLIGTAGSRERLSTPALVLDLDALERNVAAMADYARRRGMALRPHAKTHKSARLARLQAEAGAVGICVATLGEAEALAAAGVAGLLLTSPLATAPKLERLAALARRADGLMAVADSFEPVERLERAVSEADARLGVLVDVDVGLARTGVADAEGAVALARRIARSDVLRFAGMQAYYGHLQHVEGYDERLRRVREQGERIRATREALSEAGLTPDIVTGGGTGTHEMDADEALFTELQVGSYVFTDVQYDAVTLRRETPRPFEAALFVRTSVISANFPGCATTDAGLKRFATDGPLPRIAVGAPAAAAYGFMGDEHGRITLPGERDRLPLGAAVECLTPHCDPTVNLYDAYHVVRGETLVDIWPVDARGAD